MKEPDEVHQPDSFLFFLHSLKNHGDDRIV